MPEGEHSPPGPALAPNNQPPRSPPRVHWARRAVPIVGFVLCSGCVLALICGVQLPAWQWPRLLPRTTGAVQVIIDPGHGGEDSGAVAQGVVEKDLNLDVSLRLARVLQKTGVAVRLTREDDHFVPLPERVRMANSLPGAVFVSIHFNDASGNGQTVSAANGIETYYSENKEMPAAAWAWTSLFGGARNNGAGLRDARARAVRESAALAEAIQATLVAGTASANRGIHERGLYVTRRVHGPAVLVEGGFISHPAEARRLGDASYRQQLADLIAGAIVKYLEAARHAPAPTPPVRA